MASLEGQLARARGANEALASQNRALYGTLDETLAAAEHVSRGRGRRAGSILQLPATPLRRWMKNSITWCENKGQGFHHARLHMP